MSSRRGPPWRRRASESTVARITQARQNEERVLAEHSLQGEKLVAWVRVAAIVFVIASQVVATGILGQQSRQPDSLRGAISSLYGVFAVVTLLVLRRRRPNVRSAFWSPLAMTVVDFAFFTAMGIRNYQVTGAPEAQTGAAIFALLMVFSVARFSWVHVFTSTFFGCAAYMTFASVTGAGAQVRSNLFVLGCYTALGLLLGLTQQRVRRMFLELRRRDMLTRFLPPQLADRIARLGDAALAPVQREVTVMFTDIRDFTTLSEALPPNEVLRFLDEYFGHMSQLVKAHDGIVNKFLGDGMLAFWGVPERLERHAEGAVRAALDMRKVVAELNQVRAQRGEPPIRFGVGIHTGQVAAGMLGGAEQHEYTVIGDSVNLTSRIEGLTKQHGVDILVSESTWAKVQERVSGQRIGECHVKGRAEPVVVYRVDGLKAA